MVLDFLRWLWQKEKRVLARQFVILIFPFFFGTYLKITPLCAERSPETGSDTYDPDMHCDSRARG